MLETNFSNFLSQVPTFKRLQIFCKKLHNHHLKKRSRFLTTGGRLEEAVTVVL